MIAAFRHFLRFRGRLRRSTETVSTTGATTFGYADLTTTDISCFVSSGTGRMRKDDSGQYGGRTFTVIFGPEISPKQNDVLVVTSPDIGSYRLVYVGRVFSYGTNAWECQAEQYLPAGGD